LDLGHRSKERYERFLQHRPSNRHPHASAYPMNQFWRIVTVGHNASVLVWNRRPTEEKDVVKQRSQGNMRRNAWYWRKVRSNPPLGYLWCLRWSASILTEPFRPDGNFYCWWNATETKHHVRISSSTNHVSQLLSGVCPLQKRNLYSFSSWAWSSIEVVADQVLRGICGYITLLSGHGQWWMPRDAAPIPASTTFLGIGIYT